MLVCVSPEAVEILELRRVPVMVCGFVLGTREAREMLHRGIQLQDGCFEEGNMEEVPALITSLISFQLEQDCPSKHTLNVIRRRRRIANSISWAYRRWFPLLRIILPHSCRRYVVGCYIIATRRI